MHLNTIQSKVFVRFLIPSFLFMILSGVFLTTSARAREEIRIGRIELKPLLNINEKYIDNIFQTPLDKREDFITTVTPAIEGKLPIRKHLLTLDYRADMISYSQYDEHNTQDQLFNCLFNFNFPKRWGLRFGNDFLVSSTPPEFKTDVRKDFYYNASSAEAFYKFADRYKISLDYKHLFKRLNSY